MMKRFDLHRKKVIDLKTAEILGYIRDMDIDVETGVIKSVTIPYRGIWGILRKSKNVTVPWNNVVAIGSEFVIVEEKKE